MVYRLGIGTLAGICGTFEETGSFDRYGRFGLPLATRALNDAIAAADWRFVLPSALHAVRSAASGDLASHDH